MKITTILALLLLLTPFLGMFYWMYKSKNEELNLSTNSWHFKLLQYMWDTETYEVKNAEVETHYPNPFTSESYKRINKESITSVIDKVKF